MRLGVWPGQWHDIDGPKLLETGKRKIVPSSLRIFDKREAVNSFLSGIPGEVLVTA